MKSNTNKGITLIALVITIIILLILAGVTIAMLTGENGILNQSQKATIETYHGTVKDQVILGVNQYHVDKNTTGFSEDVVAYLVSKGYAKQVTGQEYYRVSVETVAKNIKTGKGATKDDGDIYVIEEYKSSSANSVRIASTSKADVQSNIKVADESAGSTKQYVLRYYDKSGNTKDLLYLSGNGSYVDPDSGTKPGGDDDNDEDDDDVKIPDAKVTKEIKCIEDLIDVAVDVNLKGKSYENEKIIVTKNLDFSNKSDYRDPDHYYSYNGENTEYYSLDSLKQVSTAGGTTTDDADATNDFNKETANVYDELHGNNAPKFYQIGIEEETPFKGIFDGQGNTISNLSISSVKFYSADWSANNRRNEIGMFNYNSGYVYNLNINLDNISLYSQSSIGILVGNNNGVIKKCNLVSDEDYTSSFQTKIYGGIVAINNGIVTGCQSYISNENINVSTCGGGIVGENKGTVTNCTNYGGLSNITGANLGGIIGKNNSTATVENCNNGQKDAENPVISGSSTVSGIAGIIGATGAADEFTIKNCYNYMNINGNYSAGIINETGLINTINIIDCENYGEIKAGNGAAGIALTNNLNGGSGTLFNINKCTNNGNVNGGYTTCGGIVARLEYYNEVTISNCVNNGQVTQDTNYSGGIVGRIESNKITISKCQNNGAINAGQETGGILGEVNGPIKIENCKNTGKINEKISSNGIGGIVGYCKSTVTISGCENTGAVNGYWGVGGILGWPCASFEVQNSKNSGSVKGSYEDAAGIVGYTNSSSGSTGNVFGCINTGEISGKARLAGIVGVNNIGSNLTIQNCINEGSVTGSGEDISGMCGYMQSAKIYNCGNKGAISGKYAAGIGGHLENGEIINCFNTGSIAGTTSNFGGGIAGFGNSGLISNCYNASTDITNGGGIISCGGNSFKLENVYNISGIDAIVTNYTGMPLTQTVTPMEEADMKAESFVTTLNNNKGNYSSWKQDTSTTNKGYPIFE